ncbi:hypothetical protein ACQ5SO_10445 [Rhodovulum sp. DZ06]|uniref:hypothetical protein n=1 Tax=Rhodovulum sp. DZ06 TaxID=3425126 RepID=UPI003D334DE6
MPARQPRGPVAERGEQAARVELRRAGAAQLQRAEELEPRPEGQGGFGQALRALDPAAEDLGALKAGA